MEKADEKNYYELLGVERTASLDEIKQAFKDIVIVYHPDSNFFSEIVGDSSNSPEEIALFKKITHAYQTLINKEKREEYDKELNKSDLQKGRQPTTEWIRPDGAVTKERRRGQKQPTITDLQKYQQQYRERQMQRAKTATVAEILEETHSEKKTSLIIIVWATSLFVIAAMILAAFLF
jgi:curved DNA-binding protein CbpA